MPGRRATLGPLAYPAGAGLPGLARPEVEQASRTSQPPARHRLARYVRAAAAGTSSEYEWLRYLRNDGVLVEPKLVDGQVRGYRVALPTPDGKQPTWYAGSQLHRDLSLPRLRARWPHPPPLWVRVAVHFWTDTTLATDTTMPTSGQALWRLAADRVNLAVDDLTSTGPDAGVDVGELAVWSDTMSAAADLTAAVALQLQQSEAGDYLRVVADHLAHAAQPGDPTCRPPASVRTGAAAMLVDAARIVLRSPAPSTAAVALGLVLAVHTLITTLERRAHRQAHPAVRRDLAAAHRSAQALAARDRATQPPDPAPRSRPEPVPLGWTSGEVPHRPQVVHPTHQRDHGRPGRSR